MPAPGRAHPEGSVAASGNTPPLPFPHVSRCSSAPVAAAAGGAEAVQADSIAGARTAMAPLRHYRLCAGLRELTGCSTVPEADLLALLERCGAIARVELPAPRPASSLWALARSAAAEPTPDPWERYRLWERPTELCVRHDYDPYTGTWHRMETLVKMDPEPFAHGAMRECFRLKKMSQFNTSYFYRADWRACANYVAKRYIAPGTPRRAYLDDVAMQMEAKRWSARYNSLGPPKPVDFLQAFALEFPVAASVPSIRASRRVSLAGRRGGAAVVAAAAAAREAVARDAAAAAAEARVGVRAVEELDAAGEEADAQTEAEAEVGAEGAGAGEAAEAAEEEDEVEDAGVMFGVERLIDGAYVKYNGNSGYVSEDHRATPNAFSLFTFAASRAMRMVVDIQGVGDVFTDPQVHTHDGQGYGDGNLGVHGMALFLSTHRHDSLCRALGLPRFPLAPEEVARADAAEARGGSEAGADGGSGARGVEGLVGRTAESYVGTLALARTPSLGSAHESRDISRNSWASGGASGGGGANGVAAGRGLGAVAADATVAARLDELLKKLVCDRAAVTRSKRERAGATPGADGGAGGAEAASPWTAVCAQNVDALPWDQIAKALARAEASASASAPASAAAQATAMEEPKSSARPAACHGGAVAGEVEGPGPGAGASCTIGSGWASVAAAVALRGTPGGPGSPRRADSGSSGAFLAPPRGGGDGSTGAGRAELSLGRALSAGGVGGGGESAGEGLAAAASVPAIERRVTDQDGAPEEMVAAREAAVHAQIHLALARMNYASALPHMDPDTPDIPSALFHLAHAAACGAAEATVALRSLCRGLSAEILPEVFFSEEHPDRASALSQLAAWQGDRSAAMEVASDLEKGRGEAGARRAVRLLEIALAVPGWTEDADVAASATGTSDFQVRTRLGELWEGIGEFEAAAEAFEAAAEGALARSKGKLSFRLSERAEAARAMAEAGEEAASEVTRD